MKIEKFTYSIITTLVRPLVNLYIEKYVEGENNIPKKGPCIIAFNHPRKYDPLIIAVSSKRFFHFVADEAIYKNFWRKAYYNLIGCIKNGEKEYFKAVKKICNLLRKEEAIFIFSRGKPEEPLEKSKPTLAKIILETLRKDNIEVPIIPGNINYNIENGKLHSYVIFHKPINPRDYIEEYNQNKKKGIERLTNDIDKMIDFN